MEQKRIKYKNKFRDELITTRYSLKRSKETLDRIRTGKCGLSKPATLQKIETLDTKCKTLLDEIEMITQGKRDNEINRLYTTDTETFKKGMLIHKENKQRRKDDKDEKLKEMKSYQTKNRQKVTASQLRYHYKRYNSILTTIPEYMKNILEKMPNNKGFIFKGVILYGERDANPNDPITLHDRGYIYITYRDRIEKWKKVNKQKVLISTQSRCSR